MSFDLKQFHFERILNEDPIAHSITILGYIATKGTPEVEAIPSPTIIRIEKTALSSFSDDLIGSTKLIESTDIYTWLFGWIKASEERPDVKINVICPATEVHIRKYSRQQIHIVHETPALYERIVKPYLNNLPASRTQWVEDILSGHSEAEKVLFRSPASESPDQGFLILPDMKWDLTTVSSLYLVAIALSKSIRSLRDLNRTHIPLLKAIRREARKAVKEGWGLEHSEIRCYVHYQPSYYHFHVHIVNANYIGLTGMAVGQAHLLDDIISMLELDSESGPSILQRMTFSYGLGEQHGLFEQMRVAQVELNDDA
ncbi:hypothetical protein EW146_g3476 [Bondarzewia mesenterica]|uniref:Scavenger mRNA decapping enzyme n=1 Tax=Bondarzewia mesenterica TaxID=1095465 RepID=A0A4S4LZ89_9AGAM|nr:hypothetical protein EW146_g3476 [Bondarzewia mesenterica]